MTQISKELTYLSSNSISEEVVRNTELDRHEFLFQGDSSDAETGI